MDYTPIEITSENNNIEFTACAENGCVLITASMKSGANGVIEFSVPQKYAPRSIICGIYSSFGSGSDVGKVNGAYISSGGRGNIWLVEALTTSENLSFVYPLKL